MRRILVFALFLAVLALGKGGSARAWTPGVPECGGFAPQYYMCSQVDYIAATTPDSVVDNGPMPGSPNNENCTITWNSPYYVWREAVSSSRNCAIFWNSTLGYWSIWGASMPINHYLAPIFPPGL